MVSLPSGFTVEKRAPMRLPEGFSVESAATQRPPLPAGYTYNDAGQITVQFPDGMSDDQRADWARGAGDRLSEADKAMLRAATTPAASPPQDGVMQPPGYEQPPAPAPNPNAPNPQAVLFDSLIPPNFKPGGVSDIVGPERTGPDPNRQGILGANAITKGLVADTAGLPVDLMTLFLNAGKGAINLGGRALGQDQDVLPYTDPRTTFMGSQWISDTTGKAFEAVTGREVYTPETPTERIIYNAQELAANAAVTEALGPSLRSLMGLFQRAEVAAPTATKVFKGPAAHQPTPGSMTSAAAAGGGAGVAQGAYQENYSDSVKNIPYIGPVLDPALDVASALVGAIGGKAAHDVAKLGTNTVAVPAQEAVRRMFDDNTGFTLSDGTKASPKNIDVAASIAQDAAVDPRKASAAVAETVDALAPQSNIRPTTGAMSADPGLVSLEKRLRLDPSVNSAFIQNDQAVQQAARDATDTIAPQTSTGRVFTDAAEAEVAARNEVARQGVADVEGKITDLEAQRLANTSIVTNAKNTGSVASESLDPIVKKTLTSAQEKKNTAFAQIDPEGQVPRPVAPLAEAGQQVKAEAGALAGPASTPDDIIARIEKAAGEGGDGTVSFKDINALRPEISARIAEAQKAGNYPLADSLRTLKKAIDDDVANLANEGGEAGKRAQAALDIYKNEFAPIWNAGPGDPATKFRQDFNIDRSGQSTTPPSQTASRFLQPGQPEKAASLKRVLDSSDNPAEGGRAVGQYLLADLASSGAVDAKGALVPEAVKSWRTKWGDTLDLSPEFKAQLDALESGAAADSQAMKKLTAQLQQQKAVLDEVKANDTAFKHVVGKSPAKAVEAIITSGDPERAVAELMTTIGKDTAAHDGLKAAVREYLVEKGTTGALYKTSTGDNPLSFAKLDTLFKQNEKALSQIFSPKEMQSLQAAHKFLGSLENLKMDALPGSATAGRMALSDKMWKVVEIGLKTLHGGLRGGNELRNLKLAAALQGGGPDQVSKILVEMQFNPELAQYLFGRNVPKRGHGEFDAKLFNTIVLGGSVARNDVKPE